MTHEVDIIRAALLFGHAQKAKDLAMFNRRMKHRRSSGLKLKPVKLNITLRGEKGKPFRIALFAIAGLFLIVLATNALKPTVQLRNTAEIREICEAGVLKVGVRDDIPNFAENGIGFEIELARLFADYLIPDSTDGVSIEYVTVSDKTASNKLSDGSVDAVFALMQNGAKKSCSYSYPYFTDTCYAVITRAVENRPLNELKIGYVQNTSSESILQRYISAHETKVERSLLDKLLKRTVELPPDAITFNTVGFASYPDMLLALKNGHIDVASIPGVFIKKYSSEFSFKLYPETFGEIEYCVAVSSDSPAIAELANMFIYDLKQNGDMSRLFEKYGLE